MYSKTAHKCCKVKEFREKETKCYQITYFIPRGKKRSHCLFYQHVTIIKTCLAKALTF